MSNLLLVFSQCKDCGACCFSCNHLDEETGCVDEGFRLSSRCASFPVIYGNPKKMGYKTSFSYFSNTHELNEDRWFIIDFEECILLQNELIFHNLKWMIDDINSGREMQSFSVSFGENLLAVFLA